ncbi:hypothetical protein COO91_08079 [Nostoc flagelliforme CCNUN1]|uniref:Uncharacterized protein n=1 Tax=Nostoc flagelliforme CCNUN1 TaxID=2038116 RepID=A0A2K8T2R3_9NOSO|nr:hypothetical protein COO91_08079 [Nostoc flagelliforme CCNUN1]
MLVLPTNIYPISGQKGGFGMIAQPQYQLMTPQEYLDWEEK